MGLFRNAFEYERFLASKAKQPKAGDDAVPAGGETKLQREIKDFCNAQHPQWKFINPRSDVESTIAEGAQDFTIFLPGGRVVCIECKTKTGKLSIDQLAWRHQMEALGHTVHLVRSMNDFRTILAQLNQDS